MNKIKEHLFFLYNFVTTYHIQATLVFKCIKINNEGVFSILFYKNKIKESAHLMTYLLK